jgi:hypothetical protein
MLGDRFDDLWFRLVQARSRRGALSAVGAMAAVGLALLGLDDDSRSDARRRRRRKKRNKKKTKRDRCRTVGANCAPAKQNCCRGLVCAASQAESGRCCREVQATCTVEDECCGNAACAVVQESQGTDKQALAGTRCCLEFGASCTSDEDCCGTLFCNANVNNTCD